LYEARVVRRDGQTREVFFAKDVFYDENGQVAGIVGAYMDITEQKQAIASLRASQEAERLFSARLTRLVTAITDLSATPDFDTLCRRAIEQGISQLGFERLGLWFFVPGQPEMYGTFGVDEQGHIRDERGARITIQPGGFHDRLRTSTQPDFLGEAHTIQDDQAHVIAEGQRLSCGLWDGQKILGTLSSDNLLSARPLTNQDKEILRIYAAALGHLCTLKLAQAELHQLTNDLEQRVQDRTRQLEDANRELEAFSYSVSHDLRSPLRAIDGFSRLLMEDYADQLPPDARQYLERVRTAAQHMGQLIDDLLNLSRLSRAHVGRSRVNLSQVAQEIAADLTEGDPERPVDWQIAPDVIAHADANLIRIVLDNLLRNAWKFTAQQPQARIEFGCLQQDGRPVYVVRDNGAGFDMAYADKLFRPFQRLHSPGEFEGTGIGLTIVQRIIHRHGGRIWPEAAVGQGAAFYFTLG
jgi:signal transduction histidine kinase